AGTCAARAVSAAPRAARAPAPGARRPSGQGSFRAMQGLMQDAPLTLPHLFHRVERLFPEKEIVTATGTGQERTTYGEWADRTRRLGGVLDALGISGDGRVATFAWNTARHL